MGFRKLTMSAPHTWHHNPKLRILEMYVEASRTGLTLLSIVVFPHPVLPMINSLNLFADVDRSLLRYEYGWMSGRGDRGREF